MTTLLRHFTSRLYPPMLSLLILYLLTLLAACTLQEHLLYFPTQYSAAEHAEALKKQHLEPWPSATDFRGIVSASPVAISKGTVLVFHGNAGAALDRWFYIAALQRLGYRVILAEYPGYGARPGKRSEASLVSDGLQTAKLAAEEFKEPLFLLGESIGSGVVAGVIHSGQVRLKGLVLITPFASLTRVAQHHYWFFLPRLLLHDKFDNISNLSQYTGNVAIVVAGQDEIVPNQHSQDLFNALPARKKRWQFDEAGHNSLPMDAELMWWQEVMQFVDD